MNKTKIDWCDCTWNVVTGCKHGCLYCYANRIANRFGGASETHYNETVGTECQWETGSTGEVHVLEEAIFDVDRGRNAPYPFYFDPTFHRYRLDEPQRVKVAQKIFVVSMGDLFGDWVPDEWISEVMQACNAAPWHIYQFLTKNPARMRRFEFPANMWVGTSIAGWQDADERIPRLLQVGAAVRFVSIEPILAPVDLGQIQFDKHTRMNVLEGCGVSTRSFTQSMPNAFCEKLSWVIVGAQTGPGAVTPEPFWVQGIIEQCRDAGAPLFLKDNLKWPEKIQEFPVWEREGCA